MSIFRSLLNFIKPAPKPPKQDIWKFEIYDRTKINIPTTNLFKEGFDTNFKGITSYSEKEIIDFLIHVKGMNLILEELGMSGESTKILIEQVSPFIEDKNIKPGDIDLIIYDSKQKDKAIAIEVKCVKAETFQNREVKFNKEKNLTKGITQVNEYLKLGFYKTFLMIIILDDGMDNTQNNQFLRDVDLRTSEKLFNNRIIANLNDNVGMIYLKINQITGKSIKNSGKISILMKNKAKTLVQNTRIAEYL